MWCLAGVDEFGVIFDAEEPLALDDDTFDSDAAGDPYQAQTTARHAGLPPGNILISCKHRCRGYTALDSLCLDVPDEEQKL